MKFLVVGQGGREHAMVWKLSQSPLVEQIFVAPGNAGTATEAKAHNVDIPADDISGLRQLAKREKIDYTIIGPEAPLALGIVDAFQQAGLACFGPSQQAAMLESSKSFSKQFMLDHDIPTAAYRRFNHPEEAKSYINNHVVPVVIKADGLAAGKGVDCCHQSPRSARSR